MPCEVLGLAEPGVELGRVQGLEFSGLGFGV